MDLIGAIIQEALLFLLIKRLQGQKYANLIGMMIMATRSRALSAPIRIRKFTMPKTIWLKWNVYKTQEMYISPLTLPIPFSLGMVSGWCIIAEARKYY